MKRLVSAIVTSYNHAEYLDQRMESLLGQTYGNTEIIVVDDCSTDGSRDVLEKYKGNEKVRIVLLENNRGYAVACNYGVELSRGEYIMFAECDDYNDPRHIEILADTLDRYEGIDVAFTRSNIVDGLGNYIRNDYDVRDETFRKKCAQDTFLSNEFMAKQFLFSCVIPNMSAALIRKSCFIKTGGLSPNYRACADWDFWCRMTQHTDFFYISAPLNYFRSHQNTVRTQASVALQAGEYYELLYPSFRRMKMGFLDSMRFRMNCGFIWGNFISVNPSNWFKSFPEVLKRSFRQDKLSFVYLLAGLSRKAWLVILNRIIH